MGSFLPGDQGPSGELQSDAPSARTLRRYGLTEADWWKLFLRAKGVCEICGCVTKRLCIDHEHVKGWKKMAPEERKKHVRGLLCWRCNVGVVGRGVTVERASAALEYLKRYEIVSFN